ncbi:DUF2313 domain-containing protein [Rhizobium sp. P38BS-XIX]|uniref:YmfQ family protein n=1 Tax=Rhizobium sp. P38BS-XIX TaxID=2726740 RepID=UPI0014575DFE|nr:putative phage tail protein [Rhizobium sp. P38BS-XIX]NLS00172.1 DUF2313 domain-containing protein [Rhizobium sp. P38BS-XIX]
MARSVTTVLASIIGKLAPGWALGFRDGILDTVLSSGAERIAEAEAEAEALMVETDPRSAVNLLSDFERVLGPDPCGRDLDPLSLEDRQRLAHQRWTATGGQSIPYMVSVAQKLGVPITIEEFWPSVAGRLRAGQRLRPQGSQFVYRVNIPGLITVVNFRAGASVAGNRLGTFKLSNIECELRRIRPGHTDIVFKYGA